MGWGGAGWGGAGRVGLGWKFFFFSFWRWGAERFFVGWGGIMVMLSIKTELDLPSIRFVFPFPSLPQTPPSKKKQKNKPHTTTDTHA